MNFYEIAMTFSYVLLATGIITLGCHITEKIESVKEKVELDVTNVTTTSINSHFDV